MPVAIINGRRVELPHAATADEIRKAGGIQEARNLIRRTREGNHLVPVDATIDVHEGDAFIDAPARIKGGAAWQGS